MLSSSQALRVYASLPVLFLVTSLARTAAQVGVGTTTPHASALLHVQAGDSINKALVVTGTRSGAATVGNLGAGSRMIFSPGKAAFRAGNVNGLQWDNANVGASSFAAGINTTASGVASTAMGGGTWAKGDESSAFGESTIANAFGMTVVGTFNDTVAANPVAPLSTNPVFVVGNGLTSLSRSNALMIRRNGNTGLGEDNPRERLHLGLGNIRMDNSSKGIMMDAADKPIITRAHDTFTSGPHEGIGRWGLFMEPHRLTAGIPNTGGKGFKVSAYNPNGTIAKDILTATQDGNVDINNELNRTNKTGAANLVPIAYGSVKWDGTIRTGTGNFTVNRADTGEYYIVIAGENVHHDTHVLHFMVNGGWAESIHAWAPPNPPLGPNPPVIPPGSIEVRPHGWGVFRDADFFFMVYRP